MKGLLFWCHRVEDALLVLTLAAMVLLGTCDLELWQRLGVPIQWVGADGWVRHLTLLVGIFGGTIATREGKLLSFSTLTHFLPESWQSIPRWISGVAAAAIALCLGIAAGQFFLSEKEAGQTITGGIPVWWFVLFLPAGFFLIALRLFWHTARGWKGRLGACTAVVALVWLLPSKLFPPEILAVPFLILLGVATLLGAPIFVTLGGTALIFFWRQGDPIASISLDHYDQITNPLLATLPLFTLAGYFLAASQASRRLVDFFQAWTGHIRGGPAIVTALACAFFTTFTGGSGVTILALGGLLLPVLTAARYAEKDSIGLLTAAGSLGILFPPCLPLIIYSIIAGVEMNELFLGGFLPGAVMVALTIVWGIGRAPTQESHRRSFSWSRAWRATWAAKWELGLPLLPLVLIFGGWSLPVPAAAATALYAFLTQTFVHRELKIISTVPKTMIDCGLLVGGVLLILGTAMGLTNYLITQHIPDQAAAWIGSSIAQKWLFLLILNLFLLLVGCLMDIFAAIVVVVPLLLPMTALFDIPPVQLGIIFLANLQLGYLTPPVGMNLFLASYRFEKTVWFVTRATFPFFCVLGIGVVLTTYVPAMTTWLPQLLR